MAANALGAVLNQPANKLSTIPATVGLTRVAMTSDEVTAICPVTRQPDLYTVRIEFEPNNWCIESKSLKFYLWHFRDEGVFAEHLATEICEKIASTIQPKSCRVVVIQKPRGGITIEAEANYAEQN